VNFLFDDLTPRRRTGAAGYRRRVPMKWPRANSPHRLASSRCRPAGIRARGCWYPVVQARRSFRKVRVRAHRSNTPALGAQDFCPEPTQNKFPSSSLKPGGADSFSEVGIEIVSLPLWRRSCLRSGQLQVRVGRPVSPLRLRAGSAINARHLRRSMLPALLPPLPSNAVALSFNPPSLPHE